MKLKLFIAVIFIIQIFFSCHKEETHSVPKPEYYPLAESLRPYIFKQDSYWIFENDSTKVIDSVAVISLTGGKMPLVPMSYKYTGDSVEAYMIECKSFLTWKIHLDYLIYNYIKRDGGGLCTNYMYAHCGQPIFMVKGEGTPYSGMKIIDTIPTMTILGHTFKNVVETKITASEQTVTSVVYSKRVFDYDTYLYFSDSIGIIKKVSDLGNGDFESWSIKRWNVIK